MCASRNGKTMPCSVAVDPSQPAGAVPAGQPGAAAPVAGQAGPQYYKPKEPSGDEVSPLEMPPNATQLEKLRWGALVPIHYMCRLTMPDCRKEQYRRWYPFTFVVSMIWISFYSYIMVWMITVIGELTVYTDRLLNLPTHCKLNT